MLKANENIFSGGMRDRDFCFRRRTRSASVSDFLPSAPLPVMLSCGVCRRVDIGLEMPLRETEAIVLRSYKLGEADCILSLFTRQWGRLRAVAAGARRPRSRYGSSLEPLGYVHLWLYERENRELLRLNSAELLESFFEMQRDYRLQLAGHYVAEVAEAFLPERETNDRAFRLMLAVLRALKRSEQVDVPLVYFDLWILLIAGLLPPLERCGECGESLTGKSAYFGPSSESLRCNECRGPEHAQELSPEARSLSESARRVPLERWLETRPRATLARKLRGFLEDLIEGHAEKKLITRAQLAQID